MNHARVTAIAARGVGPPLARGELVTTWHRRTSWLEPRARVTRPPSRRARARALLRSRECNRQLGDWKALRECCRALALSDPAATTTAPTEKDDDDDDDVAVVEALWAPGRRDAYMGYYVMAIVHDRPDEECGGAARSIADNAASADNGTAAGDNGGAEAAARARERRRFFAQARS